MGKFESTLSRSTVGVGPVDVRTEDVASFRRICLQDNEIAAFVQLGVRRRYQKLRDELLGQCRPMPKDRPHRCLFKERKAAIMIDLDGTLMDSTVQRGRALERALAELHATSLLPETFRNSCNDHASRLDFFEKTSMLCIRSSSGSSWAIFARNGIIRAGMRLTSPLPGTDGASSIKQVAEEWQRLDEDRTLFRVGKARRLASLRESPAVVEFRHEYEKHLRDSGTEIDRAVRAFSRVRLHPLKEARDLLTSLKQTGAFNLYIVSEGYPDTQWNKLCSIGLSKFFGRSHVLTTGDVAPEYDNERRQFEEEKRELRRRREKVVTESRFATKSFSHLNNIQRFIAEWDSGTDEIPGEVLVRLAQEVGNRPIGEKLRNSRQTEGTAARNQNGTGRGDLCRENPGRVANETEPVLCRRNPQSCAIPLVPWIRCAISTLSGARKYERPE